MPFNDRRGWISRAGWAVADQGLFAGANFLVAVGLAGWLTEYEFGAFTTAYASFLIIGVFTTALLTEPMMVFGSQKYRGDLPTYLGKLVGGHLLLTLLGGLIMGAIAAAVAFNGQPLLGTALGWLAVTQVSQLLPWMTRNACYIESNPRPAAIAGMIYLVLVLGALIGLASMQWLSIVTAIATMAGASLLANVYLLVKLRVSLRAVVRREGYAAVAADHWRYGKWAVPTNLTHYIPEQLPFIAVPVVLGWAAGGGADLEAGGTLKALMNFAVPFILLGWAVSTLLVPMLVRARHTPRFMSLAWKVMLLQAGVPLLCWPVLGIFGESIVGLVYHGKFVEYAGLLWLIGLIPVVSGFDTVLHTQLKAAERPDRLFYATVAMAITLVAAGLPLLLVWGLTGAVVAILLGYVAKAVTLLALGGRIILENARPLPEGSATAGSDRPTLRPMTLAALPQRPLVSVIMANYNYERYVGQAVRSVLAQTYPHFELIVVDDGSADGSVGVLASLAAKDARITVIEQDNRGQAGAWNHAFTRCRGELLCLLDADDCFEPDKLARVVERFTAEDSPGMVQHPLQVVDADDAPLQVIPFLSRFDEGWLAESVLRRGGRWCFMPTSALSFRMEVARLLMPLEEPRFRRNADVIFFTVAPLLAHVGVINRPLARYRVHGSNQMSSGSTDRPDMRKRIRSFHDTIVGSNAALRALGRRDVQLDPADHLLYRELLFVLSMLRGRRRGWVGRYAALLRALWADDMYGRPQKILGTVMYGVLPWLPRRWRGPWLDQARTFGRLKGRMQSVLRLSRYRPRLRQAAVVDSPMIPEPDPTL